MKSQIQKSLTLLAAVVSLFASLQIPAMAEEVAGSADVEQSQLSADESTALDLGALINATDLDQNAAIDVDTQDSNDDNLVVEIGRGYRPRPYPVYIPRSVYSPYQVCFARDAYGRTFRAGGNSYAGRIQRIAVENCERSGSYGCRPVGCQR